MPTEYRDVIALALHIAETENRRIGDAVDMALRQQSALWAYARAWDAWAADCGNEEACHDQPAA